MIYVNYLAWLGAEPPVIEFNKEQRRRGINISVAKQVCERRHQRRPILKNDIVANLGGMLGWHLKSPMLDPTPLSRGILPYADNLDRLPAAWGRKFVVSSRDCHARRLRPVVTPRESSRNAYTAHFFPLTFLSNVGVCLSTLT